MSEVALLTRWGWRGDAPEDPGGVARVTAEFRGGYLVHGVHGELKAGSSGKLRRAIKVEGADKPAVGDWVSVSARPAEGSAVIHGVVPRRTCVVRRAAGGGAPQVVAANVDVVMIVSGLVGDLNVRRLERYLAVVREAGAAPVVVLTKADLAGDAADAAAAAVRAAVGEAPVHVVDALGGAGVDALDAYFAGNATVALVGSSGVGKSTLINRWLGGDRMKTGRVLDDGRGRHTTTHRELFLRPAGGLVMDTPGMRELGLWEAEAGLADTFADVEAAAASCRFGDCRHAGEPGCGVDAALAAGELSEARVTAWRKLAVEMEREDPAARKRRGKALSRAIKKMYRDRGDPD